MKVKTTHAVAKSLLIDVDAILCGEQRPIEERHSAAASAIILATRMACGVCINLARIADSLDKAGEDQ